MVVGCRGREVGCREREVGCRGREVISSWMEFGCRGRKVGCKRREVCCMGREVGCRVRVVGCRPVGGWWLAAGGGRLAVQYIGKVVVLGREGRWLSRRDRGGRRG